jgi:hypothetical protein
MYTHAKIRKKYQIVINVTIIVSLLTIHNKIGFTNTCDFDPGIIENRIYAEGIHTVMLSSSTWELSMPVLVLGSEQQLELLFDDLSGLQRNFGYTLVHCNASWKLSDLTQQEYLKGFGQGIISEMSTSFNTTVDYAHYRLIFPNEDCLPVISGNYALVVYENDDPETIILTRRFYVIEKTVQIEGKVKQPSFGANKDTDQQVEFTVLHNNLDIRDPFTEIAVVVQQNGRDDRLITDLKPLFIKPGKTEFTDPDACIFPGGNEFRSLDIKSMKYQTENIASIDFQNPYYHVFMKPDETRAYNPYFYKNDLNGGYYIDREKATDKHQEADYVYVHFTLNCWPPLADEEVYVMGSFCDWTMNEKNKMAYNAEKKCYELALLLKQGLYDYCYLVADKTRKHNEDARFEGNYYETENDYAIYVYFHDQIRRFDRLIGYLPLK